MPKVFLLAMTLAFAPVTFASDSLSCEGKYDKQGQKHGNWACRKDKHVIRREKYSHGTLKSYIIYNHKGEIVETRNKKGKIMKYKPCGC